MNLEPWSLAAFDPCFHKFMTTGEKRLWEFSGYRFHYSHLGHTFIYHSDLEKSGVVECPTLDHEAIPGTKCVGSYLKKKKRDYRHIIAVHHIMTKAL